MGASIDSHIFETGTPYPRQGTAPDSRNFMTPRPVQCLHCQTRDGMEVCPSTSLPLRSSAFPIHWQSDFRVQRRQDHQLRECFCSLPLKILGTSSARLEFMRNRRQEQHHEHCACNPAVAETLLHQTRRISPRSAAQTVLSTTREMRSTPSKRESISMVACVEEGRHVQGPVPVDVECDFNLRQATWCWHDPSKMELPKQIVVLSHPTLPFEDLDKSTRLVDNVHRKRQSLLRRKGSVAFDELGHDVCSLQTH